MQADSAVRLGLWARREASFSAGHETEHRKGGSAAKRRTPYTSAGAYPPAALPRALFASSDMTAALIETHKLTAHYGDAQALLGIDFKLCAVESDVGNLGHDCLSVRNG